VNSPERQGQPEETLSQRNEHKKTGGVENDAAAINRRQYLKKLAKREVIERVRGVLKALERDRGGVCLALSTKKKAQGKRGPFFVVIFCGPGSHPSRAAGGSPR